MRSRLAWLGGVPAGEDRNVMHRLPVDFEGADHVVHGGQESVRGLEVRSCLDVEPGLQTETPASIPIAQTLGQSLRDIARFEVASIEIPGCSRVHEEGDRSVGLPGVVGAVDAYGPGPVRVVDDSGESRLNIIGGREHGNDVDGMVAVSALPGGRRRHCKEDRPEHDESAHGAGVSDQASDTHPEPCSPVLKSILPSIAPGADPILTSRISGLSKIVCIRTTLCQDGDTHGSHASSRTISHP